VPQIQKTNNNLSLRSMPNAKHHYSYWRFHIDQEILQDRSI